MLAVKKVCGISRIKRARAETVKRRKYGARPFPAVAQQVMHAKGAGARGIRSYRAGIPMSKIEISVQFRGLRIAPRIKPLLQAFRNTIRRAMELLFQCNHRLVTSSLDESLVLQHTLVQIVGGKA